MKKLHTKSLNRMRWTEYELVETGVRVREKDLSGIREVTVEYDRLGKDATYFLHHSAVAFLGVMLFLFISLASGLAYLLDGDVDPFAWTGTLAVSVIIFIYYLNTRREGHQLASDFGSIVISGKKGQIDVFLNEVLRKKSEALISGVERRLKIMEQSEVEKYLLALRDGSVVTQEQYDTIRIKTGLQESSRSRLGFQG